MWGTPQGMVYLATGHHEMRKPINGLELVVAETLRLDSVGSHWFVLCNQGSDRLKILHWDTNVFWLHCCLEQGKFHWSWDDADTQSPAVTARQLRWLIDGLSWQSALAHQPIAPHLRR